MKIVEKSSKFWATHPSIPTLRDTSLRGSFRRTAQNFALFFLIPRLLGLVRPDAAWDLARSQERHSGKTGSILRPSSEVTRAWCQLPSDRHGTKVGHPRSFQCDVIKLFLDRGLTSERSWKPVHQPHGRLWQLRSPVRSLVAPARPHLRTLRGAKDVEWTATPAGGKGSQRRRRRSTTTHTSRGLSLIWPSFSGSQGHTDVAKKKSSIFSVASLRYAVACEGSVVVAVEHLRPVFIWTPDPHVFDPRFFFFFFIPPLFSFLSLLGVFSWNVGVPTVPVWAHGLSCETPVAFAKCQILLLMIILITVLLSSNTHNKTSQREDWTFEGTQSMFFSMLIFPWDFWRFSMSTGRPFVWSLSHAS